MGCVEGASKTDASDSRLPQYPADSPLLDPRTWYSGKAGCCTLVTSTAYLQCLGWEWEGNMGQRLGFASPAAHTSLRKE